jgi:hypothetical protein
MIIKRRGWDTARISSASRSVIDWIVNHFGGKLNSYKPGNPSSRRMYTWCITGHKAKDVLYYSQPYLVIKSEQAKIALSFPIGNQSHIFTSDEMALRQASCERMGALNAKGVR